MTQSAVPRVKGPIICALIRLIQSQSEPSKEPLSLLFFRHTRQLPGIVPVCNFKISKSQEPKPLQICERCDPKWTVDRVYKS